MLDSDFNVGVYQGQPVRGDTDANLMVVETVMKLARSKGLDLVLFGELFLSGYDICKEEMQNCSFSLNESNEKNLGPIYNIAKENNCGIAVGYSEDGDDGCLYNSCCLVDANGTLVHNYRKCHLWDPEKTHEKVIFQPGAELNVSSFIIQRTKETVKVSS